MMSASGGPVSLIVVNYGTPHLVIALLDSLRCHTDAGLLREAIVVDNGYPERGDVSHVLDVERYPFPVECIGNPESSYSSGVNRGAARARGDILAIANSDLEWLPETGIGPLVDFLREHSDVGVAGPQLLFPDRSWQRSFGPFPSMREALGKILGIELGQNAARAWRFGRGLRSRPRDVDYVDGAYMMIRRACFEQLSGFDERFGFYVEDADFCFRAARAGWRCVFVPAAQLTHVRGASSTAIASRVYIRKQLAARRVFVEKHSGARFTRPYALMQIVAASELAAVYRAVAAVRHTPRWQRRAYFAREAFAAACELGLGTLETDAPA